MLPKGCVLYTMMPKLLDIVRCALGTSTPRVVLTYRTLQEIRTDLISGEWPAVVDSCIPRRMRGVQASTDFVRSKTTLRKDFLDFLNDALTKVEDVDEALHQPDLEKLHESCFAHVEPIAVDHHQQRDSFGEPFSMPLQAPEFAPDGVTWDEKCECKYVHAKGLVHALKRCRLHGSKRIGYTAHSFGIFDKPNNWRIRVGESPQVVDGVYDEMVKKDLAKKDLGWLVIEHPDEWRLLVKDGE